MNKENKQWFETWFDSPYYHVLYDHRNVEEAELFISTILDYLHPKPNATFLDLACGAGRHSKFINSLGYNVTGVDLSANSIQTASKLANSTLDFFVHDMRKAITKQSFNYIFNLFTSFGYFEDKTDNLHVLEAIKSALKPNGTVVIDFMNARKSINNLIANEKIIKQNIEFQINRRYQNEIITKSIRFNIKGEKYHFEEKVQALLLKDFEYLCNLAGFSIVKVFGDYSLNEFDETKSDRLIMILKRS